MSLYGIDPTVTYEFIPLEWRESSDPKAPIVPKQGAPVIILGPLSERMSLRVWDARVAYSRLHKGKDGDGNGFSVELRSDLLADVVKGWRGVRRSERAPEIPFTGKWATDGMVLPMSWKDQIFWEVLSENAFTEEAARGFTLPPALLPA